MAKAKKRKKRDSIAHPGLDKKLFSKIKQEYHDIDYAHTLDDKSKKWLSQFMEEHLGAQLNEQTLKNKYNRKPLHKTKKRVKDCYDRNNARQRDIYGLSKATGRLDDYNSSGVSDYIDKLSEKDDSVENRLIEKIDKELEQFIEDAHLLEPKKDPSSDT